MNINIIILICVHSVLSFILFSLSYFWYYSVIIPLTIEVISFGISISSFKHSAHKKRVVKVAPSHEGNCMTAPLSHGPRRKNARGPEDKSFQPFALRDDAILFEHALSMIS